MKRIWIFLVNAQLLSRLQQLHPSYGDLSTQERGKIQLVMIRQELQYAAQDEVLMGVKAFRINPRAADPLAMMAQGAANPIVLL